MKAPVKAYPFVEDVAKDAAMLDTPDAIELAAQQIAEQVIADFRRGLTPAQEPRAVEIALAIHERAVALIRSRLRSAS